MFCAVCFSDLGKLGGGLDERSLRIVFNLFYISVPFGPFRRLMTKWKLIKEPRNLNSRCHRKTFI